MKKNIRRVGLHRHAGNLLIPVATALGVMGLIQVGTTKYMVTKAYEAKGTAIGSQMAQIQAMLDSYVSTYYSQLQNTTPVVPAVSNALAPTLTELQNLGLSNTSVISAPAGGGTYQTAITRSPAGCSAGTCNLRAKVWLNTPITDDNGSIDLRVLGAAVAAGTGGMGFSLPASPTTIQSAAGWTEANPDATNRAGIIMAVTGYDASAIASLIRRDGTRSATANHDWGGHDLTNMDTAQAANMQATSNVAAGNAVTAGGSVTADGEVYAGGWLRNTQANTGWYNQAHGVGMYAADSSWVRSYNNAGIYTGGQVQAGSLQSNNSIVAYGTVTSYAPSYSFANDWSMLGYGAGGVANVAPQSYIGSAYLNDAYFRSAGKWASQIMSGGGTGMTGLLYPLRGKTISCAARTSNGYWTYHRAYVDGNGNPYVSAGVGGHGSYVYGTSYTLDGGYNGTSATTTFEFSGMSGSGVNRHWDGGSWSGSCTANWPAT